MTRKDNLAFTFRATSRGLLLEVAYQRAGNSPWHRDTPILKVIDRVEAAICRVAAVQRLESGFTQWHVFRAFIVIKPDADIEAAKANVERAVRAALAA